MISSRAVKNLLATLFWVAAWYLLAVSMGNPLLLPTPVQVLRRLWELPPQRIHDTGRTTLWKPIL